MAMQSTPCTVYVDNRPTLSLSLSLSLSLILNADLSLTLFNHQPDDLLDCLTCLT